MKWYYIDHSKKGEYSFNGKVYKDGVLAFSCEAGNVGEADFLFLKETGNSPIKMPHIGCCWEAPLTLQVKESVFEGNYEQLRAVMARRLGREWTESIERDVKKD